MAFQAVGPRGEKVALFTAVGDTLVDGETVLAQVAGVPRFMAAALAHVLSPFLKW